MKASASTDIVQNRWLKRMTVLLWLATAGVVAWAIMLFVIPRYLRYAAFQEP